MLSKGYENALVLVTKTIDKVMTGEIQLKDLVVSKLLRQDLIKYKSLFPHVSAALQLTEAGNLWYAEILFNTSTLMRLTKIHFAGSRL